MKQINPKLVAVVGPTGSGKTALAVALAQKFNGALISADSRQVYRGLDIGTNKEPVEVPQYLIDIAEPGQRFTLNDWLQAARALLPKIWAEGRLPIVVGGTGLYISALLDGYQLGGGRGAKNNRPVDFESLLLQLDVDRTELNKRSDKRFARIFDGLELEIKQLLARGVSTDWLDKLGLDYHYGLKPIMGEIDQAEAIAQYQQASRQYIRRQLTWWRHHGQPILVKTAGEAIKKVTEFIET